MFLSVRRCVEFTTRQGRLRANDTLKGHGYYTSIRVCPIFLGPLDRASNDCTQIFLLVRQYAKHTTELAKLKANVTIKVMGYTLVIRVRFIISEPFQ